MKEYYSMMSCKSYIITERLTDKSKSNIYLPGNSATPNWCLYQGIRPAFVQNQISELKTNKAVGLDRISTRLLKDVVHIIFPCLIPCPGIWKSCWARAFFKKADHSNPSNYRPITISPTLSKILKRSVYGSNCIVF